MNTHSIAPANENQLHPELLSVCAINPFHQYDSASRVHMLSNHLGQMLVLNGSTERAIQSGMEREYGKYTFNVKMPCDGQILHIIERYRRSMGEGSINENPQTIVIYENVDTKQIGMINLVGYCSNHQYFGFQYAAGKDYNKLTVGAMIAKDAVFLESPSITPEGGYKYGVQANIAYMTHPATSEDGVLISADFLPKLGFKTYETRVVEWGNKKFALNLYGKNGEYKSFPDIGEVIREDGVLMALRSYDPSELSVVEQGVKDATQVDYTFDTTVYANGPGGKIVDIRIHHDFNSQNHAEVHMDEQSQRYDRARRQFYASILEVWKKLYAQRKDALQITPEFSRMVVEAQSVCSEEKGPRVSKTYRQTPLDDYRIEFVIEYDIVPSIGFKITDLHGGKGVMCQVAQPEEMPIDAEGNRADIVMDPNSTISRMNIGRLYEQYYNAASRDTHKRLCAMLGLPCFLKESHALSHLDGLAEEQVQRAFDYLLTYYSILSPDMHAWFTSGQVKSSPRDYLSQIVERGITIYLPTNNQPEGEDIVMQLEQHYKPCYGPVSYIGNSGKRVVTKDNIRIGGMYFILLEKIGDDWSAVSSGKLQHFGVLAQVTKTDKYAKPARNSAVRGAGEAEVRIFASYIGGEFVAELMDRNNNPKTHKMMVKNILSAKEPSNIENLVDRNIIPFGGAKPISLVSHLLACGGFKFKYEPYQAVPKTADVPS